VPTLRNQVKHAQKIGMTVETVRRTGEVRFRTPHNPHVCVTVNNRRKDSTREVQNLIRYHEQEQARVEREG
jgi:diaminopimelate epimerase